MTTENIIFERPNAVMKASVVGFYTSKEKSDRCNHIGCGYPNTYRYECRYNYYFDEIKDGKMPTWLQSEASNILKHKNAGCMRSWCVVENGAKKEIKKVKCKKSYYRRYSDKELADPKTKPEIMALSLDISCHSLGNKYNIVALYNLEKDDWHIDEWWSLTSIGNLMLCQNPPDSSIKVRDLAWIKETIEAAKRSL